MGVCIFCNKSTTKYKCPKCFEYYCGLDCYKSHKDSINCQQPLPDTPTIDPVEEITKDIFPFKTEDTVNLQKLQELKNSESLKTLLHNPHLRNLLVEIDSAESAWKAITAAMQEPLFLEFADECLKIVEPDDESNE